MYLIDHVAELRFVNRLIYATKRIYTQKSTYSAWTRELTSQGRASDGWCKVDVDDKGCSREMV